MGLEDKAADLRSLEIGNVEKAIGEIEIAKNVITRSHDATGIELEVYKTLIKEKLPKIIDNISLLGEQISQLPDKKFSSFYPMNLNGEDRRMEIGKYGLEKDFNFLARQFDGYRVEFYFKTARHLDEIALSTYEINEPCKSFFEKKNKDLFIYVKRIKAKSSEEFVEVFSKYLIQSIKESDTGKSEFETLPFLLNLVPSNLVVMFRENQEASEEKEKLFSCRNHRLGQLDISDFK